MHSTLPQRPAGTYPAPGALRRLLGDLLERIENSAAITGDILQILKAQDGPLRADDRPLGDRNRSPARKTSPAIWPTMTPTFR